MTDTSVMTRLLDRRLRLAHLWAAGRQKEAVAQIPAVTAWVEHMVGPQSMTISVVIPTKDRGPLVSRALDSVLAQRHQAWEAIVIDDGSQDGTADRVAALGDERVRIIRAESIGCAAARNRGLDIARGDAVVYLDDDNVMHPLWLHAVAWAFSTWPELESLYGARVVDGDVRVLGLGSGQLPKYHFVPFNRRVLRMANFIDMGTFAHRRELDTRFAEGLSQAADWDFILRSTRRSEPLALPVIANFYTTDAPDRLSSQPGAAQEFRLVASRQGNESRTRG